MSRLDLLNERKSQSPEPSKGFSIKARLGQRGTAKNCFLGWLIPAIQPMPLFPITKVIVSVRTVVALVLTTAECIAWIREIKIVQVKLSLGS